MGGGKIANWAPDDWATRPNVLSDARLTTASVGPPGVLARRVELFPRDLARCPGAARLYLCRGRHGLPGPGHRQQCPGLSPATTRRDIQVVPAAARARSTRTARVGDGAVGGGRRARTTRGRGGSRRPNDQETRLALSHLSHARRGPTERCRGRSIGLSTPAWGPDTPRSVAAEDRGGRLRRLFEHQRGRRGRDAKGRGGNGIRRGTSGKRSRRAVIHGAAQPSPMAPPDPFLAIRGGWIQRRARRGSFQPGPADAQFSLRGAAGGRFAPGAAAREVDGGDAGTLVLFTVLPQHQESPHVGRKWNSERPDYPPGHRPGLGAPRPDDAPAAPATSGRAAALTSGEATGFRHAPHKSPYRYSRQDKKSQVLDAVCSPLARPSRCATDCR